MDARWRHPYGLRPTLRHLMILVVYAAIVAAVLRGAPGVFVLVALPLSVPLLALLVMALERPSPAKYWLVGLLASLFVPGLVVSGDVALVQIGISGLVRAEIVGAALVVINAVGVFSVFRLARRLPRPCAGCGLRSALPLGRGGRGMCWCASCGHVERTAATMPHDTHFRNEAGPM